MPLNLVSIFFLLILLGSLILILVYLSSYYLALFSSVREKTSETVHGEDMAVVFSSLKPSYTPGEEATFNIYVSNLGEYPIYQVNFTLTVKAQSLFGATVYSMEGSSTRIFVPGIFERMRTYPADAVEVILPEYIPPGFYILELSAKPSGLKPPPRASIVIYVEPSTSIINTLLTVLIFSGAIHIPLDLGAHVDPDNLPKNYILRNLALFAYLINVRSLHADVGIRRTFNNFSVGQKFVFLAICSLIMTIFPVVLRFETFANDLAILIYFSLVIGVVNLFWENFKTKTTNLKLHPSSRLLLSLIALGLSTYLSNKILGTLIFALTLFVLIRVAVKS